MEKNIRSQIAFLITIILSLFYFILVYYPMVGDGFDYWHMAKIVSIEKSGIVDLNYPNAGYYVMTLILSNISGISYDTIPIVPLQFFPFVLLLIMLLRYMTNNYLLVSLIVMIFTTKFGYINYLGWWSHGIGIILLMLIISLVYKLQSNRGRLGLSLTMIITIVSLNYMSYKLTFFAITFLIGMQIVQWRNHCADEKLDLAGYILIGTINALIFNGMFYQSFIPHIRSSSGETVTSALGKLLIFGQGSFNKLGEYHIRGQQDIVTSNIVWHIFIILGLFLLITMFLCKLVKKDYLNNGEKIAISLIISGLLIFLIYTFIGFSDVTLLIFSGIIGYAVLYNHMSNANHKIFIFMIISTLLLLNIYTTVGHISEDFNRGKRDMGFGQYLYYPSDWYVKKMIKPDIVLFTDVFTGGYFAKEIAKNDFSSEYSPHMFSRSNMLFLFNNEEIPADNNIFVVNYRLHHFSADNWETFSSWSNYEQKLENNKGLDFVYTSGDLTTIVPTNSRLTRKDVV